MAAAGEREENQRFMDFCTPFTRPAWVGGWLGGRGRQCKRKEKKLRLKGFYNSTALLGFHRCNVPGRMQLA